MHDNLCYLTIKSDTGQHSQFLRCSNISMGQNRQIWDHLKEDVKSCVGHAGTHGRVENFAVCEICRFVEMGTIANFTILSIHIHTSTDICNVVFLRVFPLVGNLHLVHLRKGFKTQLMGKFC